MKKMSTSFRRGGAYLIIKPYSNGNGNGNGNDSDCCLSELNIALLNKYYQDYTLPYYNDNYNDLLNKIQTLQYENMIKAFKPYLTNQKDCIIIVNKISLMSLTSIERGLVIESDNKSLKIFIKHLEETQKAAINSNINVCVDTGISFVKEYLLYIKKYGVPIDGIFNPVLLSEFL